MASPRGLALRPRHPTREPERDARVWPGQRRRMRVRHRSEGQRPIITLKHNLTYKIKNPTKFSPSRICLIMKEPVAFAAFQSIRSIPVRLMVSNNSSLEQSGYALAVVNNLPALPFQPLQ